MGARAALAIVAVAAAAVAGGILVASASGLRGAGSQPVAPSCSPADQQYANCGRRLECTVAFVRPIHLDDNDQATWDSVAPVWEGDSITISVSGCPSVTLANADVTWLRDGKKVGSDTRYAVGHADIGHNLGARIKIHGTGRGTQIVEKQLGQKVEYAPPEQLSAPSILGQENLHLGGTLSADPGTWELRGTDPGPLRYTYCWTNDDANEWSPPVVSVEQGFACNGGWTVGTGPTLTLTEVHHGPSFLGRHIYLYVFAAGSGAGQYYTKYYAVTRDAVGPAQP